MLRNNLCVGVLRIRRIRNVTSYSVKHSFCVPFLCTDRSGERLRAGRWDCGTAGLSWVNTNCPSLLQIIPALLGCYLAIDTIAFNHVMLFKHVA